jgi:hypothetical protein
VLIPIEADVESDVTPLLVDDSPVDSEPTPLCAVLTPAEADVESDETPLLVVDSPADSELTPL